MARYHHRRSLINASHFWTRMTLIAFPLLFLLRGRRGAVDEETIASLVIEEEAKKKRKKLINNYQCLIQELIKKWSNN
jgi:hypothetical protein